MKLLDNEIVSKLYHLGIGHNFKLEEFSPASHFKSGASINGSNCKSGKKVESINLLILFFKI